MRTHESRPPIRREGGAVFVPLTRGLFAEIDEQDYDVVHSYVWRVLKNRRMRYAVTGQSPNSVLLHRLILAAPAGLVVDHIDGNGLNNRRSNIRLCSVAENNRNLRRVRGVSRYKGVNPHNGKWRACISNDGKDIYLGCFSDETEAARAYDAAAVLIHGKFARTNQSMGLMS